jgi:hypothetical protein
MARPVGDRFGVQWAEEHREPFLPLQSLAGGREPLGDIGSVAGESRSTANSLPRIVMLESWRLQSHS